MPTVKKAVIAAAGRGTRFLPITKIVPKEMLPIGNQPLFHYLLKECKDSGIEEVAVIVRKRGNLIEKYYSQDQELEEYLRSVGKDSLVGELADADFGLNLHFFEQNKDLPYGNGTPMFAAREWLGNDNFAFMFGDDLFKGETPALKQLIDVWEQYSDYKAILGAVEQPDEAIIGKLGIVQYIDGSENESVRPLARFVEKPSKEELFSNHALIGRAVFSPAIFSGLDEALRLRPENRELWLWDAAWQTNTAGGQMGQVGAYTLDGKWLTTGTPEQLAAAAEALLGE